MIGVIKRLFIVIKFPILPLLAIPVLIISILWWIIFENIYLLELYYDNIVKCYGFDN